MRRCSQPAKCGLIWCAMRHKYDTRAIVIARSPLGEANTLLTLLTPELGLVRARAQGLRRPAARLAAALATYAESDLVLVRGKESWRVAGAVLAESWSTRMGYAARQRAGRISRLLLRLVAGESQDPSIYRLMKGFFTAISELPENTHEAAEIFAALQLIKTLGLDTGAMPGEAFTEATLASVGEDRARYIGRINHGIEASGL
jgi:DNA repair protein RecO